MMNESVTVLALLGAIGISSYHGHRDDGFRDRWIFDAGAIRLRREYHRLITCCGLHADLRHYFFNAITIYLFGDNLDFMFGSAWFLTFFFASVLVGSLFSYWLNRDKHHLALGASGGACGLIFANILTAPGMSVSLGLIPVFIPGWAYAILFILGSYVAHQRKQDNIGHDAHLGGALGATALALIAFPHLVLTAPWTTWLAAALLGAICFYLAVRPHGLAKLALIGGSRTHKSGLRYQRYDEVNPDTLRRRRLDSLLDIIAARGPEALTTAERQELDELSKVFRDRRKA